MARAVHLFPPSPTSGVIVGPVKSPSRHAPTRGRALKIPTIRATRLASCHPEEPGIGPRFNPRAWENCQVNWTKGNHASLLSKIDKRKL
ncbi:hypothetical protein EJB05_52936, partial [Eragrostis curvula]